MIGDDRRGALHDRHPIGVGGAGDQNRTIDEAADVAWILDQADTAGDGRIADAQAGDQPPATPPSKTEGVKAVVKVAPKGDKNDSGKKPGGGGAAGAAA